MSRFILKPYAECDSCVFIAYSRTLSSWSSYTMPLAGRRSSSSPTRRQDGALSSRHVGA